jgi:hypothetical protein
MSRCTDELSCAAVREGLDDYLDGALAEDGRRRLEGHLASCAGCAAELRLAEEVLRQLHALPELDCPPRVLERAARLAGMAVAGPAERHGLAPMAPMAPMAPPKPVAPLAPLALLAPLNPMAPTSRAARTAPNRSFGAWRRPLAAVAALLLLALTASLVGSGAPRPDAAEVARGAAQARFALAYVGRVSERAGWRLRRQVLARRVVEPLTENLSQSLFEAFGERRDAVQGAAQALRREARKET